MALDLSKLTDAVTSVAVMAASVASVAAERDAAKAELMQAQTDVDALTAKLLAAATTPAETAGLTAVAAALAPVSPTLPAVVAPAPVAPVAVGLADTMADVAAKMAAAAG